MRTLNLKTKIGNIIFSLRENYPKENWFDFDAKCIMREQYSQFYPREFFCSLHYNDLIRLACEIERLSHEVKNNEFSQNNIDYMPLEADFQLMLYDGWYEDGCGEFSICFMIHMEILTNDEVEHSHFGFKTLIDFNDMQILCNNIRELVGASENPMTSKSL